MVQLLEDQQSPILDLFSVVIQQLLQKMGDIDWRRLQFSEIDDFVEPRDRLVDAVHIPSHEFAEVVTKFRVVVVFGEQL